MSRGRGTVRGIFAGFLGLVALHAVGSRGGSGRIAEAFADVSALIERVMDPNVPAIPNRMVDPNSPGAKAAAAVAEGKAAGGVQGGISDRLTGRLPIPDPPK